MSTLELYIFLTLPGFAKGVITACGFVIGGCILTAVGYAIARTDAHDADAKVEYGKSVTNYIKGAVAAVGVIVCMGLVPTERVMYALVAWEMGSSVDGLAELPAKSVEYLNEMIDEQLQEIRAEKIKD